MTTAAPSTTDLGLPAGLSGAAACCSLQHIVGGRPFCRLPASWACRLACCGAIKVVCDRHRDPAAALAPKVFLCRSCRARSPRVSSRWPI